MTKAIIYALLLTIVAFLVAWVSSNTTWFQTESNQWHRNIEHDKQEVSRLIAAIDKYYFENKKYPDNTDALIGKYVTALYVPRCGCDKVFYHRKPDDSGYELTLSSRTGQHASVYDSWLNAWKDYES